MKKKITRELVTTVLARKPKMCSFLEWKDLKVERLLEVVVVAVVVVESDGGGRRDTERKSVDSR